MTRKVDGRGRQLPRPSGAIDIRRDANGGVFMVTDKTVSLPWTADPWLRWDAGQAVAVGAAIGILTDLLDGDLDPGYWRLRVGHALEALGAAVAA